MPYIIPRLSHFKGDILDVYVDCMAPRVGQLPE